MVTDDKEIKTLIRLNGLQNTLTSIGFRMKTGLTVDFRNRDALKDVAKEQTIPLFYSQHIQNGGVVFPVGKEHEYIITEQNGLLQKNKNCLLKNSRQKRNGADYNMGYI